MILTLIDNTGQPLELNVPTIWDRVTVRQFIAVQGKDRAGQLEALTGVTLPPDTILPEDMLSVALEFLNTEPEYTGKPYPKNIGAHSIGQAELAKKVIADTVDNGEYQPLPYLYAIYLMPNRFNMLLSFVQGFPEEISEAVRDMPICQVYAPAMHFYRAIGELVAKYVHAIHREPEPEQEAAGVERFAKFGFFNALYHLDDPNSLLAMPADWYYMKCVREAVQMDFQKDYQLILEAKQKA